MPDLISHQGLSVTRLVGYHWFGGEAIFGIPIGVSVDFIFLFVLGAQGAHKGAHKVATASYGQPARLLTS